MKIKRTIIAGSLLLASATTLLTGCDRGQPPLTEARANLLTALPDSVLRTGGELGVPVVYTPGTALSLAWRGGGSDRAGKIELTLSAQPTGPSLFETTLQIGPQGGTARIGLPHDLPYRLWLRLRLRTEGPPASAGPVSLSALTLERLFLPLNIVLIIVDTLRPDYLGCYGYREDVSPNIDRLAGDGVLYETVLCHAPITGPSHASLFTSLLPSQTGLVNNGRTKLPKKTRLLAELLTEQGYHCGAVTSIAPLDHRWGFARGFDIYDDRMGNSWILRADTVLARSLSVLDRLEPPFFFWSHFSDPHEPYDAHGLADHEAEILIDGERFATVATSTYRPQVFEIELPKKQVEIVLRSEDFFFVRNLSVRKRGGLFKPGIEPRSAGKDSLLEYRATIKTRGSRKIGLVVSVNDACFSHPERQERYAREVAYTDRHVGALLDSLRARDLYDESLIIFTSDHGEALGCHNLVGHIHKLYDCMTRVPLIVKPPRSFGLDGGERRTEPVALIDLLPTILEMLGLQAPPEVKGRSIFTGARREPNERLVFLETHRPEAWRDLYGLRGERFKIILEPERQVWEFYDLPGDPQETADLYDPDSEQARLWQKRLLDRLQGLSLTAPDEKLEVPMDEQTAEMLHSLGY